ncbi:MAG TPA: Maf family protein [Spirochaetota bacterium]|nr:Maf family protein [Spirochaetota bacterium]
MRLILASSSPRRRELLGIITSSFEIIAPDINEDTAHGETPLQYAERMAFLKASAVRIAPCNSGAPASLVIACDTIVTIDGRIIGKPVDFSDACGTLRDLSGRTHQVITSLSLRIEHAAPEIITASEITNVTFRELTEDIISRYLNTIHYNDKAGSYALQEHGGMIIDRVEGSVSNVIGFPLGLFLRMTHRKKILDDIGP